MRITKADLHARLDQIEAAFDALLASHKDYTQAKDKNAVDHEWAKEIEARSERIRHMGKA